MKTKILLLFSICTLLWSCESTRTAIFDQYSYQKTIELKVETKQLLGKSSQVYEANEAEINQLLLNVAKLTEYEKNKPNNETSYEMWQLMANEEKNLLAGFFKYWKEKKTVSTAFKEEAEKQIMEAFDVLIQFEVKKDKPSQQTLLDIITKNK